MMKKSICTSLSESRFLNWRNSSGKNLEQHLPVAGPLPVQMFIGFFRSLPPARRTHDIALLDEERLIDFLYRAGFLTHCRGDIGNARGPAFELVDKRRENTIIHLIEP